MSFRAKRKGDPTLKDRRPAVKPAGFAARRVIVVALSSALLLSGCAARRAYQSGRELYDQGNFDQAVIHYTKALALDPGNLEYAKNLERAKVKAAQYHFDNGQKLADAGQQEAALLEYQQAIQLDPTNKYILAQRDKAMAAMESAQAERRAAKTPVEQAKEEAEAGPPQLPTLINPRANVPLVLKFRDTGVKQIYEYLGKIAGINMLFDRDLRDDPFSIDIANVTFKEALDLVLLLNSHFVKPINSHTLLVIPDSRNKRQQYEDQVVRTFYLSNADINQVVNHLRAVLKVTNISQNTTLNAITVRDTPSVIELTNLVVDQLDKAPPEIIVDVEILEISRTKFKELGTALSSYSVGGSIVQPDGGEGAAAIALPRLTHLDQSMVLLTLPSASFRFMLEETETKTIARPQIRAQEAQQVTVRIGDQVPIPTTTFAQGVNQVTPITNFQYRDIGLNIDLTPLRIHHDGDTTITMTFQLNSITSPGSGATPPTFGNRQVTTTIRLHDGETTLLTGLLQDQERSALQGVPWLAKLPVIGKLFGSSAKTVTETDIVLTLTPHIVRLPEITAIDLSAIYVGPEASLGTGGGGGGAPVPPTPAPTPPQQPSRAVRPGQQPGGAQPDQPQNIFDIFRRQQEEQQKQRQQQGEQPSPFGGTIQGVPQQPPPQPDQKDDNPQSLRLDPDDPKTESATAWLTGGSYDGLVPAATDRV